MNYTSQEEQDHFEGAAEQSALQEPMTNIEERLAEFDKEFCQRNELGHYEIAPIRVRDYTRNDPIKKTNTILKEDLKAFLAESMNQAIAEERERIEKMRNAPSPYPADGKNPMKHVYQTQGYAKALNDILTP